MPTSTPAAVRRKELINALASLDTTRDAIAAEVRHIDKSTGTSGKACSFCLRSHTHAEVSFVLKADGCDATICDVCIDVAEDKLMAFRFNQRTRDAA